MKNRKSIFAFFAICAAMIFASCSNIVDANVSSSSEDKNTLNIEVTNYDEVVTHQASKSANHASRTIIPDSFDSDGVDFYLYGTNTSGGIFGPSKVDFKGNAEAAGGTSKTVGTVSIPANSAVWEFTLVAVTSGAAAPTDEATLKNDAVLIGYSSMDMLNGDTAKFTLSPDGLTKEAKIAMKLYTDGWTFPTTGFTAKAGIYLLTTGADAGADATPTEKDVAFTATSTDEAHAVDYAIASFTPGTYLFKVTFERTGSNKKFYWSDVLVVLPGKTIDNVVGIPNVIGTAPAAPTDFKAGYVENSEDKFSGWYTTAFEWVRGSKNENNFEIEVFEFKDADTVTPPTDADAAWPAVPTAGKSVTYDSKFSEAANYESGSLLSGNTKAQLRLELGKRYFARIRAVNDAEESDWTLVDLATAPAEPTGIQKFTGNTINRYRLTYFMNGGSYYTDKTTADADTAGTGGKTADIVEYYCENSTAGTPITKADGTPIIKKNTYTWSYWSKDGKSETASRYNEPGTDPANYKGYKNLDLYAMFTTDASVAIFDKKSLEIQDGWITVDTGNITGKTATIEVATETGVKWTFTPGEVKDAEGKKIENFAYDKVNFTVTKGGTTFEAKSADNVSATKAAEFTMSLSDLPTGSYQVMFTAHYGTTTVSYPITATIKR